MICTKCGAELPDDAVDCAVCGETVRPFRELGELPVITTEEKLLEYPPEATCLLPADSPEKTETGAPCAKEKVRRSGKFWDIAALALTLLAASAAFYPLCRDFAGICVQISEAVGNGDVFPVEGMVFASVAVLAAFAADIVLSLRNALSRNGRRSYYFYAFPVVFAFWLFARLNETPARFVAESETAQALLCGSRMFYKDDFALIALVILALSLCAQVAAHRKRG